MNGTINKEYISKNTNNQYNIDVLINNDTYNILIHELDSLSILYNIIHSLYNKKQINNKKEEFEHSYIKNNEKIVQKYWIVNAPINNIYLKYNQQKYKIPNNEKITIQDYLYLENENKPNNQIYNIFSNILHKFQL
tara:strand:- start:2641 stop:3048 length:408 start_codon:yes stop_codon:yes gene_type:complete